MSTEGRIGVIFATLAFVLLVSGAVFGKLALRSDRVVTVTKTTVAKLHSVADVQAALGKAGQQVDCGQFNQQWAGHACTLYSVSDGLVIVGK